jgi:hypothetical protein
MKRYTIPVSVLLVAAFLLSGCGVLTQQSLPTLLPPEMIGTEVVETSAALATQTAQNMPVPSDTLRPSRTPRPSETPRATYTPSITPSPTVPFVVNVPILYTKIPATPTSNQPTSPPDDLEKNTAPPPPTVIPIYGATVYTQNPPNGTVYSAGTYFTATWLFSNDTKRTWSKYEVDFLFWGGAALQDPHFGSTGTPVPDLSYDEYDLPFDVAPNGVVTMAVRMLAPSKPGTYTSTWLLHEGNRYYIKVSVTIVVR